MIRAWIYARLSNDDDPEMNALANQREICRAFAEQHGYSVIGESLDDNISGMTFGRRGLDLLTAAADAGQIDALLVKDDCVIIELNAESLIKCGFCAVSSIF